MYIHRLVLRSKGDQSKEFLCQVDLMAIFTSISIAISAESIPVPSVESPIVHPTHASEIPTRAAG